MTLDEAGSIRLAAPFHGLSGELAIAVPAIALERMDAEAPMQLHPMPEFGSFTLLLALTLESFIRWSRAGWRCGARSVRGNGGSCAASRLGETARRAGIGSFVAVTLCGVCAGVGLVHERLFGLATSCTIRIASLPTAYKFSALWSRAGGLAAAVGVAAERVWVCAADAAQGGCAADGVCVDDPGGRAGVLSAAAELCGASVCDSAGAGGAGWLRVESRCCSIRRW